MPAGARGTASGPSGPAASEARGTTPGPSGPTPSDARASARRRLLEEGRERGLYSGAAWSLGDAEGPWDRGWTGTRADSGPPLDGNDLWDLASVTKPLVGLVVMALVDRGDLRLGDTVGQHLARYADSPHAPRTIAQLLDHTSGLPGGVPLYREHPTRESLLTALGTLPRTAAPGTRVTYSSQGFMLLGLIAEQASGRGLDELVGELVCAPLGLTDTCFRPAPAQRGRAVATEACPWRGRTVVGEVHDENAVVLGGVAGHAGLFSTLADLERIALGLLGGGPPLLEPDTLTLMTAPRTDHLNLRRALAWQGQDPTGSPVGDTFGPASYGHTGFTGTSLWLDPAAGRYAILLTNRVHPSRVERGFTELRREFHTL
ncbi:serine hydrolase domain-containing protein [Streptomyces drozdowiczii]|uniref:Beta-lactamase family protein n=1 Tax=Streptomyces drozdowiczii TaxID=202862 RepID=A0ABY6Q252_9ACTN|nr:serine hydrolase domain-containing protein [Streptomyces drozdowiczii]MCX0242050.1 beta-lactamase family protein [Streptomyces drozdowiczii]UZK58695.1 beta-lactamase family protein [Streptomyces drozdowiczii]